MKLKFATVHYPAALAILLLALVLFTTTSDANLARRLIRRQAEEREQESTTEKSTSTTAASSTDSHKDAPPQHPPARLYPELPPAFRPPPPGTPLMHHPHISGPTPFVPFGIQAPTGRLNHVISEQHAPQMPPQPRPMTPADRLQSQTFANGLGRRLLTMIGINLDSNNQTQSEQDKSGQQQYSSPQAALQNATVLQQLNSGVHSVYEGLSKVYNSTIQQQMANLQQQLKKAANTTNPWMQNMSQETARFYKSLVARVERAQDNLNKLWQEATQANETTLNRSAQQHQPSAFERFFQNAFARGPQPPLQEPVALYPEQPISALHQDTPHKQQGDDLGQKLMHFWNTQVRPQMAQVQNQVSSVWNDMFRSGAFTPDVAIQTRRVSSVNAAPGNKSAGLIDDILKDVEMVSPEYKIEGDEPKSGDGSGSAESSASEEDKRKQEAPPMADDNKKGQETILNAQMQNGLINAQRELNQLWMGLSNTLQSAVERAKHMMDPQPTFGGMHNKKTAAPAEVDPAENEINSKIKELGAAQRDADMVYNVVQQQQREAERKSFTDHLRNFWRENNVDQLPNRIGESFTKFGNTMSNFWNQVPERWDSFVHNMRPHDNSSSSSGSTTTTTTTTTTPGSV